MIKAARPSAAPSPSPSPSRPPTLKRTATPAFVPSKAPPKPFPTPSTATTTTSLPTTSSDASSATGINTAQPQLVSLSGTWLLDVKRSDSIVPLYEYHHTPYSASTVDRDQCIMHIEQRSDRLTINFYILSASFPLSSFSLSSPPPSYSVSYPITSHNAATAFHPIRLPHRTTTARCYPAPHYHSILIDTCCQSKYDLERREYYYPTTPTATPAASTASLLEEVRVLSCDPTVPDGGGRKGVGVASVFAKGLEGKEVVARNKTVVKELLMLKRVWTRWDGGSGGVGKRTVGSASVSSGEEVKEGSGKVRLDGKGGREKRKKLNLSDVKEDVEDDGGEDGTSQLLSPPAAAAPSRGPSPASIPSTSPSVSSVAPRPHSPLPLPPAAIIRSPSPLPALSTASLPLPDLTGVYKLDKSRSQSLTPLLARYHIRPPTTSLSPAARLRQCKQGMKPSPAPLLPSPLFEIVRLSCHHSNITTAYYVCKQQSASLPVTSYPLDCYVHVATEQFIADGVKRTIQSELHPSVEARCLVKDGAVVVVEAEGEVQGGGGGGRWREVSELRQMAYGLELIITRLEAGQQPLVVKRVYQTVSGSALDVVRDGQQSEVVKDKEEVRVARKESIEHDSRAMEDDSAKAIQQHVRTKAAEVDGAVEEEDEHEADEESMEIEQVQPTEAEVERAQLATPTETAAHAEVHTEAEEQTALKQIQEQDEQEEEEEEVDEETEAQGKASQDEEAPTESVEDQTAEGADSTSHVKERDDEQPAEQEAAAEAEQPSASTLSQPTLRTSHVAATATQPSTVEAAESADVEEKEIEVDTTSREQPVLKHSEARASRDEKQALWRRKSVWLVAFLAIVFFILWNSASER